jgi:PKD domain
MVVIGNRFTSAFAGRRPNEPTPAPPGPDIRLEPDYVINGRLVNGQLLINGSTNPDPTVANVEIDWGDGTPRQRIVSPYGIVHQYAVDAVYPLRVYATDVDGRTTQAGASVQAQGDPTNPPVASFIRAPEPSTLGQPVTFDATASTPSPGINRYQWQVLTAGGTVVPEQAVVNVTLPQTGLHVMRLTVWLPDGRSDMSQLQFNVNPAVEEPDPEEPDPEEPEA